MHWLEKREKASAQYRSLLLAYLNHIPRSVISCQRDTSKTSPMLLVLLAFLLVQTNTAMNTIKHFFARWKRAATPSSLHFKPSSQNLVSLHIESFNESIIIILQGLHKAFSMPTALHYIRSEIHDFLIVFHTPGRDLGVQNSNIILLSLCKTLPLALFYSVPGDTLGGIWRQKYNIILSAHTNY